MAQFKVGNRVKDKNNNIGVIDIIHSDNDIYVKREYIGNTFYNYFPSQLTKLPLTYGDRLANAKDNEERLRILKGLYHELENRTNDWQVCIGNWLNKESEVE